MRDHPRSRGVYQTRTTMGNIPSGSSPLARGLRRSARGHPRQAGIIPARAGFTAGVVGCRTRPRDHPRSRGVYLRRVLNKNEVPGSSPLARGLLPLRTNSRTIHRIIPARAGFTRRCGSPTTAQRDHPRSRGVYFAAFDCHADVVGSSPLARGLLGQEGRASADRGIIPARAGFTGRTIC